MKDLVIVHPVTQRIVRATVGLIGSEHTARCLIEARVGGLHSVSHYLNSVGIWCRVVNFADNGLTFQFVEQGAQS